MSKSEASSEKLVPVRVAVRQIDYLTLKENALGNIVDTMVTAYGPGMPQNDPQYHPELEHGSQAYADMVSDYEHGALVMLRPQAYVGLKDSGAVRDVKYSDEEPEQEEFEDEELIDVATATVDDLAQWIRQERPTVNDVVQASDGEPENAKKLLEAESQANDGEPRSGVVKGLTAVISRG